MLRDQPDKLAELVQEAVNDAFRKVYQNTNLIWTFQEMDEIATSLPPDAMARLEDIMKRTKEWIHNTNFSKFRIYWL